MKNTNSDILAAQKNIEVRFNEVDMMGVVWHGSYPIYLEDAREAFGAKYGLSYHVYIREMIFAPIVELKINYKRPLQYGDKAVVKIIYRPSDAAKILFDYEIFNPNSGEVYLTASSVQVFMDPSHNLLWESPSFYVEWKKSVGLL